jgi:pyruvate dehydrogenase kinase 2/3/4
LKKFADFGKNLNGVKTPESKLVEIKSYEFLKEELLVRLAQMSKEMLYLPEQLTKTSSVQLVYSWYLKSFEEVLTFKEKKSTDLDLLEFKKTLDRIVQRHSDVVQNMAMGILQVQETYGIDNKTEQQIQYFLDRFLMSRISIRMLINQHVIMFMEDNPDRASTIGAIDPNCDVLSVLKDAYNNAKFLCDQYYLCSPDNKFELKNLVDNDSTDIKLVYVPSHLYHIAFELYKNAMRAVIETNSGAKSYPNIQTLVVKGPEDLTIRITDYGGGIPKSKVPYVFKYMYSTAPRPEITPDVYSTQTTAPLAGYGYGLPLSRLYAKYFNGDLQICSVDGFSTDAYIYLKTLSKDANESLPVHNKTSEYNYKKLHREPNSDWTS